jgi:hypothetical protein
MGYRVLALKAWEAEKKGRLAELRKRSDTAHGLSKRLDAFLKVERRRQRHPCRRRHRRRASAPRDSQPAIFSMREQAHSAVGRLDGAERRRYLAALQELLRELSASSS